MPFPVISLPPSLSLSHPLIPTLLGSDCQILTVQLRAGATIESEAGAMMYMSPDVKTNTEFGGCSRCLCGGESCCKVVYTNRGNANGFVGLTPAYPSKILPVDLSQYGGSSLISKKGVYMSNIGEVTTTANFDCAITGCCIQGMGCCRQASSGTGTVFLAAGGTVLSKELGAGEEIIVDSDSIVAFKDTVKLGFRCNGGPMSWCFGGEGCCNLTMTGPGQVVIQSMSLGKYIAAVAPPPGATNPNNAPDGGNL